MRRIEPGDPESRTPDLRDGNIERLKQCFPEAVSDGQIDFDVLRELLSDAVAESDEKYGLNWHGKRRARQLAMTPSTGTLRPCPEESVDWETTKHLMIEGDNLEVLKLLQKSYAGKVKLIYIDPPYNTGKDFVYPDDYRDGIRNYLELTGQIESDEAGQRRKLSSNPETSGRFHTNWLNMMYPRLQLAKPLLLKSGAIFISISEVELANLKHMCDQVFGSDCFAGVVTRVTGTPTGGGFRTLVNEVDYLLVYLAEPSVEISGVEFSESDEMIYNLEDENGKYLIRHLRRTGGEDRREDRPSMFYPLTTPDGDEVYPMGPTGYESRWGCSEQRYRELEAAGLIEWRQSVSEGLSKWQVYQKYYLNGRLKQPSNLWDELEGNKKATREIRELFDGEKVFSNPKPQALLEFIMEMTLRDDPGVVLDFFAGSGTTGHALYREISKNLSGCTFILIQLQEPLEITKSGQRAGCELCDSLGVPRNIAELTKERLRRAGRKIKAENPLFTGDTGFRVFKLDTSNIRSWHPRPDQPEQAMLESVEHLLEGRTELDLLYEILLKLGLELTVPVKTRSITQRTVYAAGDPGRRLLFACLDHRISSTDYETLAVGITQWYEELGLPPDATAIFRDNAFVDDVAKVNLTQILAQHGLTNVLSL